MVKVQIRVRAEAKARASVSVADVKRWLIEKDPDAGED